jgi:hypothetical protein
LMLKFTELSQRATLPCLLRRLGFKIHRFTGSANANQFSGA